MQHVTIGQAIPNQAMQSGMLSSLNSWSGLFTLVAGVVIFAGACRLIAKGSSRGAIAAHLVFLPLPLLFAFAGTLKGMISSFTVLAASPDLQISQTDLAAGIASSLSVLLAAIVVTAPTYAVLAFGLLVRKETKAAASY